MSGSLASSLEQRLQCLVRTVKTVQYINISGKWTVCFAVRQHKQWHQNKNKTYVCTSTTKPLTKSGTVKSKEMQISSKRGIWISRGYGITQSWVSSFMVNVSCLCGTMSNE